VDSASVSDAQREGWWNGGLGDHPIAKNSFVCGAFRIWQQAAIASQSQQKLTYDVRLQSMNRQPMTSNIEPIAREVTKRICRNNEMPETQIESWVELHWECAAAMLEAGVMNEKGEWIEGKDWRRGLEAYRERLAASPSTLINSDRR
jgi:hypothetical protein